MPGPSLIISIDKPRSINKQINIGTMESEIDNLLLGDDGFLFLLGIRIKGLTGKQYDRWYTRSFISAA